MSNKHIIINELKLDINGAGVNINTKLSIPVQVSKEDKDKVKSEGFNLGTVKFSEKTSELIMRASEAISKELLSKL